MAGFVLAEHARLGGHSAGDKTRAHGKENPPVFYAVRLHSPIRVLSPRQLPTDHDYAVPTRGYQSDQPSHLPLFLSSAPCLPRASHTWAIDNVAPYQNLSFTPSCITRG